MKHGLIPLLFYLTFSALILCGCATLSEKDKVEEPPELRLGRLLLERALEYERKGQPRKALQSYEAALTAIVAQKQGLEDSLRIRAEKHYRRGLDLYEQGKYGEARHEFLTALRFRPDFPQVVELLKPSRPAPHTRYLVHQVQEGEFLTSIAEKYYQDQSKFGIIARFNNLEDATKVYAGMKLKIPEIEGVSFRDSGREQAGVGSTTVKVASGTLDGGDSPEAERQTAGSDREFSAYLLAEDSSVAPEPEDYDPIGIYQEQGVSLLEEGEYLAALHEFQKVLNTDPSRKKIREYMAWAHYRQGEVFFNHAQYLEARNHFQQALAFDQDWKACKEYLKRAEDAYKEVHYLRGIQLFEEERLQEAIEQWELVSGHDPDYKQVKSYLLRAQKLLDKIQELKEVP